MATLIDDFPHHGAHYDNDERQAQLTETLLATFAVLATLIILAFLLG
jgi:hypothetical protein